MDQTLLAEKGISPSKADIGFVDGFELRIGERATLLRSADSRSYGVVMDISPANAQDLYAEKSVADYEPEPVRVELMDGSRIEAICYNLPEHKVTGTNHEYAASLMKLAANLGFPESYIAEISPESK